MPFSERTKVHMLLLSQAGHKPPTIARMLAAEGVVVSRRGVDKFLKRFEEDGSLARRSGSGRPTIVTPDMRAIVEEQMQTDDETTVSQLHQRLTDQHGCGPSASTILR